MPRPVRIVIPAIRVSAPVIPLHLNRDRTLQVPKVWTQAGWFVGGPEPGETGAAVIVGHVDSKSGPAVFYRLRALRRGDLIKVVLKNRSSVRFVVTTMRKVPKKRFPTTLVYGRTTTPTLRLITCDGRFDRSTGHYVDNYVVFATLVGG
jgi:sortase (surface protein transpeptidase)